MSLVNVVLGRLYREWQKNWKIIFIHFTSIHSLIARKIFSSGVEQSIASASPLSSSQIYSLGSSLKSQTKKTRKLFILFIYLTVI